MYARYRLKTIETGDERPLLELWVVEGTTSLGITLLLLLLQGAVVGSLVAMAFNLWIVIGNFLVSPHRHWLPTTTAMCNASSSSAVSNNSSSVLLDDVTAMMTSLNDAVAGAGSGVLVTTTDVMSSAQA